MTIRIRRPLSVLASTLCLGLLLTTGTGCGALSALGNPKVAWAIQDPAPMSVVMRRAEVAETTVQEVNRLLTATPASADSPWLARLAPGAADTDAELKAAGAEPMYATSHARVVAAEGWARTLPRLKSAKGAHANLLAAINPDLAEAYSSIMGKKVEIAGMTALIEQEKVARDAKGVEAEDKAAHQSTLTKLEKMKSESEADVAPLEKALLASASDAARQLPADQKEKLAPAIAGLLQALADADIANSAAAIRYPLALPSLVSSAKSVVPNIVADIVQEKTGKRLDPSKLTPEVTLSGTDVSVTLGGLSPADLGALKMDDLTQETIARTGKWIARATTLLGTVSSTKDALSFQTDVLTQIQGGFGAAGASGGGSDVQVAAHLPGVDGASAMGLAAGAKKAGDMKVGGLKLDETKLGKGVSAPKLGGLGVSGAIAKGGLPGVGASLPTGKLPGVSASLPTGKLPGGLAGVGASLPTGKLPGGLPGVGASLPTGKLPGVGASLPGIGATLPTGKGLPGLGGSLPGAKLSGGLPGGLSGLGGGLSAAAKLPGVPAGAGSALGAASALAGAASDPKAAAAGLAKEGASAALKKVPGAGALGGFLK